MRESVFEGLRSGATLLAASQRQVRTLQIGYAGRMQREGREAWPSPDLLTWNAWLARCWAELSAPPLPGEETVSSTLLSPVQEARLWEVVIRQSSLGGELLQSHATARTVQEAWHLSWGWDLPLPSADPAPNEDVRAFAVWSRDFDARCRARGWQDGARLPDALRAAFAGGRLKPPERLLLFGFEELTPQQERLLETLRGCGTAVEPIEPNASPTEVTRHALPGPLEEIAAAARWARERLEAGATRIGVIVPDLGALRPQLVRIFDDTFVPGAVLPGSEDTVRPYNLSLGGPLSEYPVVHTALRILALGRGELSSAEAGSLLRSPFLGGAAGEWARRALLDVASRRGESLVRLNYLLRLAGDKDREGRWRSHAAPMLAARLKDWRALLDSFPKQQPPSAWAQGFARGLAALGWPGDRALDSEEYQTLEAWRELLLAFSSLDEITGRMDYAEALVTLERMAAERIFQPESPAVPVQVMGLLEAAGLEFDCVWIAGLHDAVWPGRPRPNPFIPVDLQRRHDLPRASAARELDFARGFTAQLFASAPRVIVSHPRRSGDEDLRASPLIAHLPEAETDPPEAAGALPRLVHASRPSLERIPDARAPALAAGAEAALGTSVFKDQAACPFRAFARARLGARALEEPRPGLDAARRGILLHRAMERVWRALRSHSELCASSDETLQAAVREAVSGAMADAARERPQTFAARFSALEQARIERLVRGWLDLEKQRAPFTVVLPEKHQTASFGGLTVRVVPDRVDELEGGARVVIDYKTGTPKLDQWFGDRPDEPQLPLYALCQHNVAAVAFAQVRKGDTRFLGIAREAGLAPEVKPVADTREAAALGSWDALLAAWRRTLEALGEAFRAGDARVDPKDGPRTCQYCDLPALCRIRERGEGSPVDSDDAA